MLLPQFHRLWHVHGLTSNKFLYITLTFLINKEERGQFLMLTRILKTELTRH